MFKRFIPGLLIVIVMLVGTAPVVSSALSADDLQVQIQQLLVKIQELTKQLNELRVRVGQLPPVPTATTTPSKPPVDPIKPRVCEIMTRTLAVGGQGEDVKGLQEFLREEGFFDTEATGFFGVMTRDAVAKWQTTQGVVSSDNASAAGAGVFGPKSREFLKIRCQGEMPSGERFTATPARGESPLTVTFSTWLSGFHPNNISYTIDFGDGSSEPATSCPAPADACTGPGTNTHTYTTNGSYSAILYKVIDPCVGQVACRAAIHREMVAKQMIQVGPIACTKEYMPVCGAKPIVCITTPCNPIPTTYSNKCMMNADNAALLYTGQCKPETTTNPADDASCQTWYDGCNTCSRSTPGGPAICTLRACMTNDGAMPPAGYCKSHFSDSANKTPVIHEVSGPTSLNVNATGTWKVRASDPQNDTLSYSVTWGDEGAYNSAPSLANAQATSFTQSTSFTHSYATPGIYTVVVIVRDPSGNEARTSTTVEVTRVPVACTLQYDPVCGRPAGCTNTCPSGMYCAALCRLPDPVTYSNECHLKAAGASFISRGVCPTATTESTATTAN